MKRHADSATIAHIIELRRKLETAETKMNNALNMASQLRQKEQRLRGIIQEAKEQLLVLGIEETRDVFEILNRGK